MGQGLSLISDALEALRLVAKSTWRRNLTAWTHVPLGTFAVMAICFGIHRLISLSSVSFPASVAGMILLFLALVLCNVSLGDRHAKRVAAVIDIPCGFALRYINLFFTPAFVPLPLSPSIGGVEVAKIIAVFVIGYAVMFVFTVYTVRGLQLVLGTSKRSLIERAEEVATGDHDDEDEIPFAEHPATPSSESVNDTTAEHSLRASQSLQSLRPKRSLPELQAPVQAHDPSSVTGNIGQPVASVDATDAGTNRLHQNPPPLSRSQIWATRLTANTDLAIYTTLMLFVGLPVYYATGYAMPLQLGINIVCFFLALKIPSEYRTYLHPVLMSSAFTILAIWIFALTQGLTLADGLRSYTTGSKYIQLWNEKSIPPPGAGDVFGSLLDVSIVALALPMFQYRQELRTRFTTIVVPSLFLSLSSLFGYPAFCYAIGISSTRSLAFAGRSITLALSTPATVNLGGDLFTVAPLSIFSGIVGVAVGSWALKMLNVPDDDYITRGVTLGGNSAAIATARLLTVDPRAAAFSSLTMGLFGTITVALTSIPPVALFVKSLAGA